MDRRDAATAGQVRDGEHLSVLGALIVLGSVFWLVTYLTAQGPERDFLDSPLYWWGWLLLPALSGAGGWLHPHPTAFAYGVAAVLPQVVAVTLLGTVFHRPEHGASLWIVGLLFVLAQMAIAAGVAVAASTVRRRARNPQES